VVEYSTSNSKVEGLKLPTGTGREESAGKNRLGRKKDLMVKRTSLPQVRIHGPKRNYEIVVDVHGQAVSDHL
jgi:hypothetical protein